MTNVAASVARTEITPLPVLEVVGRTRALPGGRVRDRLLPGARPVDGGWGRSQDADAPMAEELEEVEAGVLSSLWSPQPAQILFRSRPVTAGFTMHGRQVTAGDVNFDVHVATSAAAFVALRDRVREESALHPDRVFWVMRRPEAFAQEVAALFRSALRLGRSEESGGREAPRRMVAAERRRLNQQADALRKLLATAWRAGLVCFQGAVHPAEGGTDVTDVAASALGRVLPALFHRYPEAAAKLSDIEHGVNRLLTSKRLQQFPPVFANLGLIRREIGPGAFRVTEGPLKEVLDAIDTCAAAGGTASAAFLLNRFSGAPFGWTAETVRLLILSLARAGALTATHGGAAIRVFTGVKARARFLDDTFFEEVVFARPEPGALAQPAARRMLPLPALAASG